MATCLVAEWIMAAVLYQLLTHLSGMGTGAVNGAISGATIGFGFMATSTVVNNAFPGRKIALSIIDSPIIALRCSLKLAGLLWPSRLI